MPQIQNLAKLAALQSLTEPVKGDVKKKKKKKKSKTNTLAHVLGAGAVGYGAFKAPHVFGGSDQGKVDNFKRIVEGYDPEAFSPSGNSPLLPPNTTEMGYYQRMLSPAGQLEIAGTPVGEAMVGVRSNKFLMDKLEELGLVNDAKKYHLDIDAAKGNSGMGHYRQFARGPIPAYMHQMSAHHQGRIVPAELAGGREGVRYPEWAEEQLGKVLKAKQLHAGQPWEMDTDFVSSEDQQKIMESYHESLSPEAQKYRMDTENLDDDTYRSQVNNYMPKAKKLIDIREKLQAALPYAAGGAGGHALYKLFRDKDKQNWAENLAAVGAGAGVGKGIEMLTKNPTVRTAINNLLEKAKGFIPGNKEAAMTPIKLWAKTATVVQPGVGALNEIGQRLSQHEKGLAGGGIGAVLGSGMGALSGAGGAAGATVGGLHGLFSDPGKDKEGNQKSRLMAALKGMLGGGALGAAGGLAAGVGGVAGGLAGGVGGAIGGKAIGEKFAGVGKTVSELGQLAAKTYGDLSQKATSAVGNFGRRAGNFASENRAQLLGILAGGVAGGVGGYALDAASNEDNDDPDDQLDGAFAGAGLGAMAGGWGGLQMDRNRSGA